MEKETGLKKRSKVDEEILQNLDLVENLEMYEMMKDLKLQQPGAKLPKQTEEKKK
jgi:hypothetical protein